MHAPLTSWGHLPIKRQIPTGRSEPIVFRDQYGATASGGECPERQRGRTVNPLAMPSQVRVLPLPPLKFLWFVLFAIFALALLPGIDFPFSFASV